MAGGLNEENELTIAKFIEGLSPKIANKVELKSYLSFDDVYHLSIKIDKQLKGRFIVSYLRCWQERSASNAIVMDIFKCIVPIEELSPLEKKRNSKLLKEASKEEFHEEDHTLVILDVK